MRPRLPSALPFLVLAAASIPGLLEQARDVDVLLYLVAAARANAEHALPYAAAWIEKGPLAMGLYQLVGLVCGRYALGALALVWLAVAAAGVALAAALAREAGASGGAGWAALFFAVAIGSVGGTLNTEVPAAVLAASALLVTLRRGPAWLAGLLAAGAFLCRQNAGAILPVLVLVDLIRTRRAARAAVAVAAFALPVALVAGVYAASGAWAAFRFCFWDYNASIYLAATHVDLVRVLRVPWDAVTHFLVPTPTVSVMAVVGAIVGVRAFRRGDPTEAPAILLAAVVTLAAVVPGLRYFTHYAALALPFLAALAGLGFEALLTRAGARASLAVALVAFSLGVEVAPRGWLDTGSRLARWWERGGVSKLGDPLEWPGRDESVVPVARFVREATSPDERVFVWGMRPHVLVYADRLLATRFTTCTFLTGLVPWERVAPYEDTTPWIVPGAWDRLLEDLAREKPRLIVDASHDHHFGEGAYAPERFPALEALLERDYEPAFTSGTTDRFVVWRRRRP